MRKTLSFLLLLLPLAAAAQTATRVAGPVSGIVFDRNARALRPMLGVPGASYLGDALLANLDAAAVSPDGDLALASLEGRPVLISGLKSLAPSATALDVLAGDRFLWSSDGAWAAVCSRSGAQVLRDIRTNPAAGPAIDLPADATALALGNGGDLVAGFEAGLYLLTAGSAPRLLAPLAAASAIAFRGADMFAASGEQIWMVENFASAPAASVFIEDAGAVVGLQFSADGKRLFAADAKNRLLKAFETASRAAAGQAELDCAPSELAPFGSRNLWLLNSDPNGTAPLYVATGAGDPASWFVPAGRVE
jgi:hypothetical protein